MEPLGFACQRRILEDEPQSGEVVLGAQGGRDWAGSPAGVGEALAGEGI